MTAIKHLRSAAAASTAARIHGRSPPSRSALVMLALALCGCDSASPPARPSVESAAPADPPPEVRTRWPAAKRLVAIGDLHGDLEATQKALRLGGLLGAEGRWIGGDAVLVQTGDILDRGDDEQAIIDLLERLAQEAAQTGGHVHVLNGNHELMNAAGDFRYVTPGGFADFEGAPGVDVARRVSVRRLPPNERARADAFSPSGSYARKLASHPVVLVVGDTVFAHGGVLPKWAPQADKINHAVSRWLWGLAPEAGALLGQPDSPVWSRSYADEEVESDCAALEQSLEALGVARMVVGHTVQPSITSACDGKVWRIDVGMSKHFATGRIEVLEIQGGAVRALRLGGEAEAPTDAGAGAAN